VVKPRLTVEQILAWTDAHHARRGRWPSACSGPVACTTGETWAGVNTALARGRRGLPGGDSLSRLLQRERGMDERRGWKFRGWFTRSGGPPG
jgi:hypothetical protein